MFVFTGGQVPTAQWNLAATTSYLEHPIAAECLSTAEIQRYQHLVQTIRELGTVRNRADDAAIPVRFG